MSVANEFVRYFFVTKLSLGRSALSHLDDIRLSTVTVRPICGGIIDLDTKAAKLLAKLKFA